MRLLHLQLLHLHLHGRESLLHLRLVLLHLSKERSRAYGVSIPRDAMVDRPTCEKKDHSGTVAGGLTQFNAAYEVGGPACTIKTVESITKVYIDHFVVVDFNGFKKMVDALDGVEVCVPKEVNDTTGHIFLPAGTYDYEVWVNLFYLDDQFQLNPSGTIVGSGSITVQGGETFRVEFSPGGDAGLIARE